MKTYRRFITELFDRKIPTKLFSTGDREWNYNFVLMYRGGKSEVAPRGKDLEKFVHEWFLKNKGVDISTLPRDEVESNYLPLFNKAFRGVAYIITFHDIKFDKEYSSLELMSDGDIRNGVWELDFTMREATIELQTIGRPSVSGRYYWAWDAGTDEDVNQFSGADAAMILGAVADAAKDFVKKKKPRGIILGTKETANPARGRIYKMLARSAAQEMGGEVIEVGNARDRMANGVIVWFDRENPFRVVGFPDSPYEQKA
jgi:hypothetical protein